MYILLGKLKLDDVIKPDMIELDKRWTVWNLWNNL